MSLFKVIMPKLGESIQEATLTRWFVKEGDTVAEDDILFEVATDKVDSEIPSPVEGKIEKILFPEGSLLPVGEVLALINVGGEQELPDVAEEFKPSVDDGKPQGKQDGLVMLRNVKGLSNRFYSPLVKKIAAEEQVSVEELEKMEGSGSGGRVQKKDILRFLQNRSAPARLAESAPGAETMPAPQVQQPGPKVSVSIGAEDQIIEMDRVRKLIAEHMVLSKNVSAHVTSVVEADVTHLVLWRNRVKDEFQRKYGEKLTYMPAFMEATAKALVEFPWLNSSVDGDRIILRKHINLGIAVAKPDGNLIVPVIRNAEEKNLVGLTKSLNQIAEAARNNKLSPDDIRDGTFSITNFGSFRNLIGTPIINQPQVAILATGSIEKKPAVLELPDGDVIAIRHKMFLSLSYDHRVVDGALGGAFLRRIADLLENFDINRTI
jgi:2-oxoglutarate dehydrogenase E2 component (dihydrolipoamide succinyltransferase)